MDDSLQHDEGGERDSWEFWSFKVPAEFMAAVEAQAQEEGLDKYKVLAKAASLYRFVSERWAQGRRIYFTGEDPEDLVDIGGPEGIMIDFGDAEDEGSATKSLHMAVGPNDKVTYQAIMSREQIDEPTLVARAFGFYKLAMKQWSEGKKIFVSTDNSDVLEEIPPAPPELPSDFSHPENGERTQETWSFSLSRQVLAAIETQAQEHGFTIDKFISSAIGLYLRISEHWAQGKNLYSKDEKTGNIINLEDLGHIDASRDIGDLNPDVHLMIHFDSHMAAALETQMAIDQIDKEQLLFRALYILRFMLQEWAEGRSIYVGDDEKSLTHRIYLDRPPDEQES